MSNAFGKTVINQHGGTQSELNTRFDLIPAAELRAVAEVLAYGADKYGEENWKLISYEEHLNHVYQHLNAEQLGLDTGEPHLHHALVRLFFTCYMRDKNPQDFIGKVTSKIKKESEQKDPYEENFTVGIIFGDDVETQEYYEFDTETPSKDPYEAWMENSPDNLCRVESTNEDTQKQYNKDLGTYFSPEYMIDGEPVTKDYFEYFSNLSDEDQTRISYERKVRKERQKENLTVNTHSLADEEVSKEYWYYFSGLSI